MKASQFFIATLKEAPSDAEIVSHRLMLRAGMIKRLGAGIYSYMPMGLRVIRKVEAIIRDEMNRAGGIELLMPVVQPAELWQESGRFQKYGPELMRVKDRHDRDFVIQPTSEEVITDIARQELRSYKQLPKNFYHIQTKFRDERRPRFGVMRGREFTMKDAYSFDRDLESGRRSYQAMSDAYCAIFDRMGLTYRAVAADTGAIGGDVSQEFQVIADTGEDAIVYCPTSDYAANIELAEALPLTDRRAAAAEPMAKVPTPGKSTCEDVAALLGLTLQRTVKSLVLATDERNEAGDIVGTTVWLLLVRGDHSLNEVKAGKLPGFKAGWRFATQGEIVDHFGTPPGYLGPIGTVKPVKVIADRTVAAMSDFVCGANVADFHLTGVNWGPRPARARPRGRHPQRVGRRPLARRQGHAGDPARHRGRPRVPARHPLQRRDERELPGRVGQAAADDHGLLRHRRHTHPRCGHRAEPRRPRHRVAGAAGAVLGRDLPDRLRPQRRRARQGRRPACAVAGAGRGRDPRRPRRTSGRDVRRLGTDRRALARGAVRPRPEGGPGRSAGSARRCRAGRGRGRRGGLPSGAPHGMTVARRALLGLPLAAWAWDARAGAQLEEPLADSVRSALSAAIAAAPPPRPRFDDIEQRLAFLRWQGAASDRLRRYKSDGHARVEFLNTVWYESRRAGLEAALVLGLIQVESAFRKYAISVVGARGYMQIMPFWSRLIGDGDPARLFHMQTNLRFGCVILRHYLDRERGDLFLALGRYNGSRGRAEYPNAVFAARRQWPRE